MNGDMALNGSGIGMWTTLLPGLGIKTLPVTYDVDAEGMVAVEYYSANMLLGGTGPGGEFLIMAGPFHQGLAEPWFQAAVR